MKIGVFYGGKSSEHDISVITGLQALRSIDKKKYEVVPIYITSEGEFFTGENMLDVEKYLNFDEKKHKKLVFEQGRPNLLAKKAFGYRHFCKLDCALLCLHGMNGEDGTIQGLLELSGIPYTSSGVLGSAITMDKIIMKQLFEANGLPVVPYVAVLRADYETDEEKVLDAIHEKLSFPMIVKPANLGSSIGISKCENDDDLLLALDIACSYDGRIIVEKAIEPIREINCACKGHGETSMLEEPVSWDKFLSFKDKYITFSKNKAKTDIDLPEEVKERIKDITKRAFHALCCSGIVRTDFILNSETNELYINEINSIPGSLANYLWKGESFSRLISELIDFALEKWQEKKKNKFSYQSQALLNYAKNKGIGKLKK